MDIPRFDRFLDATQSAEDSVKAEHFKSLSPRPNIFPAPRRAERERVVAVAGRGRHFRPDQTALPYNVHLACSAEDPLFSCRSRCAQLSVRHDGYRITRRCGPCGLWAVEISQDHTEWKAENILAQKAFARRQIFNGLHDAMCSKG